MTDSVDGLNGEGVKAASPADNEIDILRKDIKHREQLKIALKENETLKLASEAERKQLEDKANNMQASEQIYKKKFALAELKAQAISQGLSDIDCIAMMDTSSIVVSDDGEVKGVAEVIANFKAAKPYLFGADKKSSSSSNASVPTTTTTRPSFDDAMKMNKEEWEVAQNRAMSNPAMFNM
jgi:hypothetical protein